MPSTWDDSSDRKLLLTIIHAASVSTPKWDQIATMMGDGYTAESVRQRFQKVKKVAKDQFGEMGDVPKGSAPKGTPKKAAGKRKGKGEGSTEDARDDEESPTKKTKVKKEESGEDVDEF